MEDDRQFRVELMKENTILLVYFFHREVDWVEIEYVYTWIYMHSELVKKRMYNSINMLLFLWLFFELYLSIQQRIVPKFQGKDLHNISCSRKQMAI